MRKRDRDMLGGILDLGDTHVDEVMVHRKSMLMIDADLTPAEIVKQALDSPYTRIPLWSGEPENIIGVLHAKDLLRALAASNGGSETLDIRQLATRHGLCPKPPADRATQCLPYAQSPFCAGGG